MQRSAQSWKGTRWRWTCPSGSCRHANMPAAALGPALHAADHVPLLWSASLSSHGHALWTRAPRCWSIQHSILTDPFLYRTSTPAPLALFHQLPPVYTMHAGAEPPCTYLRRHRHSRTSSPTMTRTSYPTRSPSRGCAALTQALIPWAGHIIAWVRHPTCQNVNHPVDRHHSSMRSALSSRMCCRASAPSAGLGDRLRLPSLEPRVFLCFR